METSPYEDAVRRWHRDRAAGVTASAPGKSALSMTSEEYGQIRRLAAAGLLPVHKAPDASPAGGAPEAAGGDGGGDSASGSPAAPAASTSSTEPRPEAAPMVGRTAMDMTDAEFATAKEEMIRAAGIRSFDEHRAHVTGRI